MFSVAASNPICRNKVTSIVTYYSYYVSAY
jgi:hypothetical protein